MVRVLLVEDNMDHAFIAHWGLPASRGFEVVHVRTVAQALEQSERERFDVAIIDQRLPDGEGVGLCLELRRQAFAGPLIMISSIGSDEALVRRALAAGANDFIVKGAPYVGRLGDEVMSHLGAG